MWHFADFLGLVSMRQLLCLNKFANYMRHGPAELTAHLPEFIAKFPLETDLHFGILSFVDAKVALGCTLGQAKTGARTKLSAATEKLQNGIDFECRSISID